MDYAASIPDIIHRQYAARVAIVEAKASEANFTAFAYELAHADPDTAQQTTWAFRDEAKRFRNWIAIARAFLPEAKDDLDGISARFDKLLAFLEGFAHRRRAPRRASSRSIIASARCAMISKRRSMTSRTRSRAT